MNNNKISNPKTEVPSGIKMNDKDYMNCLLTILKEMEKNYTTAVIESSNKHLYKAFNKIREEISKLQRETYELMFNYGWYSLEKADNIKIQEKYNTLSQEYQDLEIE